MLSCLWPLAHQLGGKNHKASLHVWAWARCIFLLTLASAARPPPAACLAFLASTPGTATEAGGGDGSWLTLWV